MDYGGYYDAAQAQGWLAYFYGELYPHNAVELHPCVYNSMIAASPLDKHLVCRFGEHLSVEDCYDCRKWQLSDMTMIHYTTSAKPWQCQGMRKSIQLNREMHKEWFRLRKDLGGSWGRMPPKDGFMVNRTFGYCSESKPMGYIPMQPPPAGSRSSE